MKTLRLGKMTAAAIPLILLCLLLTAAPAHAVGTASGTSIINQASISYNDAGTNPYTALSNIVTVTVADVFAVTISAPADSSGNSNTVVYYPYTLTNTSNASDTFALSVASSAGGNTFVPTLYADDGAGSGIANNNIHETGETTVINSTGALVADQQFKFFVGVLVTQSTANGQTDDTVLTVVGNGAGAGVADDTSDTVVTTALAPALTVAKKVRNVTALGAFSVGPISAKPAETLEYQVQVTNAGAVQATSAVLSDILNANVTYVAGSLWAGSNVATFNGAGNFQKSDGTGGENSPVAQPNCLSDACGAANHTAGLIKFFLGTTANETTGGTLAPASTVYAYYRVTVN